MDTCEVGECDDDAAVLVDCEILSIDDEGVASLGTRPVAMCRVHALREQLANEDQTACPR